MKSNQSKRIKSGLHVPWCPFSVETHLYFREMTCLKRCFFIERSEKDQNCKLHLPQADYHQRHSPDILSVFGIMIGPFFSCEISKT